MTTTLIIIAVAAFCIYVCVQIYIKLKQPSWTGRSGEIAVSRKLRALSLERYRVLNDIMLASEGKTNATQIDHIVVSNYGIFCIETKAYKGWIFGREKDRNWTQVIYRYKKKFLNPLRQNFAHIRAIEGLLGSRLKAPIVPLIAFTRADKLKISGTDSVVSLSTIVRKIQSYSTIVYSDEERDYIHRLLAGANIVDKQIRKSHVKDVRALKKRA
ncbi:nuclease-related domain-containing protein [Chloroflexota bacterium]